MSAQNNDIIGNVLNALRNLIPSNSTSYGWTPQTPNVAPLNPFQTVQAATPQPTTPPTPQSSPVAQAQQINQQATNPSLDLIKQNIAKTWGADTPILQNLPMLIQAGQQLNAGNSKIDPMLPIAMALRETQGGKDLLTPEKKGNKGDNNPYDIRGIQNGQTQFVNYPDLHTATFGGDNGGVQAQGFTGLIGQNPLYQDYRNSGNMADLFSHYSPPTDKNGSLGTQVDNYNWIRSHILGQ